MEALRYHSVGLSFFTAEAFCYYLPAYLLAVLDDASAADVICDGILFHLSPRQLGKQWADSYRARIAGFTAEQKAAICDYLTWYGADFEDGESRKEIDQTIAYLTRGEVPLAASAAERLLQLAGSSGRAPAELKLLSLSSSQVTDEELAGLVEFSSLRELDLGHTRITDVGLARLAQPAIAAALRGLESLDLSRGKQLTAEGLRHLAALPQLAELKLPNGDLDDAGLCALAPLRLRRLDLTHAHRLTEAGWRRLDVSRLEALAMFGVAAPDALLERLGAAGLARLPGLHGLHELGLFGTRLAPGALGELARLRSLHRLLLYCEDLTDAKLLELAGSPLQQLTVHRAPIRSAALAVVAELPELGELQLHGLALDDEAMAWLARAARLRTLRIDAVPISDAGLLHLARCPALRELRLCGTRVTADGVAALRRAAPELRVTEI